MTSTRTSALIVVVLLAGAANARPAAAQNAAKWDVFAGYAFDRDVVDDVDLRAGWAASVGRGINGWLSVMADVSGARTRIAATGTDVTLASLTATAGARVAVRVGPFVEFGELLGGMTRTRGTAFGATSTATRPVVQAGGGVDYPFGRCLAARAQMDVRVTSLGRDYRVTAGLVVLTR